MPFKEFTRLDYNHIENTLFITNVETWKLAELNINLILCKYRLQNFSDELFIKHRVDIPKVIECSVETRRAEFLAGRMMAFQALKFSGFASHEQIKASKNKGPIWPCGYLGSISHSKEFIFTAACEGKKCNSLGVDLEHIFSLETYNNVSKHVHTKSEINIFLNTGISELAASTIIFSAKESLYKALFKYVNQFFGFEVANIISVDMKTYTLEIELIEEFRLKYNLKDKYKCYFNKINDIVITLVIF